MPCVHVTRHSSVASQLKPRTKQQWVGKGHEWRNLWRLSPPAPQGRTPGPTLSPAGIPPDPRTLPSLVSTQEPRPCSGWAHQTRPTAWPKAAVLVQPELTSTPGKKLPGKRLKSLQNRACPVGGSLLAGLLRVWTAGSGAGHWLSGIPESPPGRVPKSSQLRHGLDSQFSTPGPCGCPRSQLPRHHRVAQRWEGRPARAAGTPGSSGQGCPPPRLRGSSCTLGRPLLGLGLCHPVMSPALPTRETGKQRRPGGLTLPRSLFPTKPLGPRSGNSRVTGAFSSALSPLSPSSSSCSSSFLNSERSDCSSWETASWARQAASEGGALLGTGAWSQGPVPCRSWDPGVCPALQGQPWPPSPQGGPSGAGWPSRQHHLRGGASLGLVGGGPTDV